MKKIARISLILFLMGVMLTPFAGGGASFAQEQDDGSCFISPDNPLVLTAERGTVAIVECIDGAISTYTDASGIQSVQDVEMGTQSAQVCGGRSTAYEQFGLTVTWYQASMQVWYDGRNVLGRAGPYQSYYYRSETGWSHEYHSAFLYRNTLPGPRQQAEGWGGFSHSTGWYDHEHHMIITATASGGCFANDYFWGTLGNGWWHEVYAF